jgi:hypothetical protein
LIVRRHVSTGMSDDDYSILGCETCGSRYLCEDCREQRRRLEEKLRRFEEKIKSEEVM